MEQLNNYKDLLNQDKVKRYLAKEGIEYCYPTMKLVVGKKPNISNNEWSWLKKNHSNELKIISYDDLLRALKIRLSSNI